MKNKLSIKIILTFAFGVMSLLTFAQQKIGTNPGVLEPSAVLELGSSDVAGSKKGFLAPRVSLTAANVYSLGPVATTAVNGMMVYNTATAGTSPNDVTPGFYVWSGGASGSWKRMTVVSDVTAANGLSLNAAGVLSYTPSIGSIGETTIINNAVTYAKMQKVNSARLLGNPTGALADVSEISLGTGLSFTGSTLNVSVGAGQIADASITSAKLTSSGTAGQVLFSSGNTTTAPTWGNLPAQVVTSVTAGNGLVFNSGALSFSPATNSIPNTSLAQMAALTVKGNATNATAAPTDIAATADGQVLRRSGNTIGFGTISAAGIADGSITAAKLTPSGAVGEVLMTTGLGTTASPFVTSWQAIPATGNIYTTDGTLNGNRVVGQGTNSLSFAGSGAAIFGSTNTSTAAFAGRLAAVTNSSKKPALTIMNDSTSTIGNMAVIGFRTQGSSINAGLSASISAIQVASPSVVTDLSFGTYSGIGNIVERMRILGNGGVSINGLSGTGSRMVIADATGLLSTQTIPVSPITSVTATNGLTLSGGTLSFNPTGISVGGGQITDNTITDAKLSDMPAFTVKGRAGITTGVPSNIAATADGQVLQRTATGLAFGTISAASITDGSITPIKLQPSGTSGQVLMTTATGNTASPFVTSWQAIPATGNIYTTDGTLNGNRAVTMGTNTLAFTSTATVAGSHFSVDGSTFNVDAFQNRVGIGTTSPGNLLHVNGISNIPGGAGAGEGINVGTGSLPFALLRVGNSAITGEGFPTGGVLELRNSGSVAVTKLKADGSYMTGSLGIGNNNPQTTFHVNGSLRFEGTGTTPTAGMVLRATDANGTAQWGTISASGIADGSITPVKLTPSGTSGQVLMTTGLGTTASPYVTSWQAIPANVVTSVTSANGLSLSTAGVLSYAPITDAIATTNIVNNAVTYAKMQQVTASRLLGNPTGATANVSEISLGTGLSFSGSTLSVNQSALDINTIGGTLPITKLTPSGTTGQVLTSNGASAPTWQAIPAASNIYNTDGVISGNRTVTVGTNTAVLTFLKPEGTTNAAAASLPVVRLSRTGVSGQSYNQNAEFSLGKYLETGLTTNAKTQLDIRLNDFQDVVVANPVMSLRGNGNVGIGTSSPNSTLDVEGSIANSITKITDATTLSGIHHTILANASSAGFAITLPAPTTCTGRTYVIRKTDNSSNTISFTFTGITSDASGPKAIRVYDSGTAVVGDYISSLNYVKTLRIQSDGTDWYLID